LQKYSKKEDGAKITKEDSKMAFSQKIKEYLLLAAVVVSLMLIIVNVWEKNYEKAEKQKPDHPKWLLYSKATLYTIDPTGIISTAIVDAENIVKNINDVHQSELNSSQNRR
jgi:hypothetical protein